MEKNKFSLTEVDPKQDIASCATCFARNYDAAHPDAIGKRVDSLYKLRVDSVVMRLCDTCLDQLADVLNSVRCSRVHAFRAGDEVYVLERDEAGVSRRVSGYIFLAEAGGRAIVSPCINGYGDLDGIMEHHAKETAENYDTNVAVYPITDCYADREEAHRVLCKEKGENNGLKN